MAAWDSKTKLSAKAFMENYIEIIKWNDQYGHDATHTNWRLTLGYDLSESLALKGGVSSYSDSYNTNYGLTFGIQNKY